MGYFDEGSTLPPPYNIIISPKSAVKAFGNFKNTFREWRNKSKKQSNIERNEKVATKNKKEKLKQLIHYKEVMKRLVCRYIYSRKKQMRADGVNEDDLLEIKQDISSLRFELREERKREAARMLTKLDSIKRDLIRALHASDVSSFTSQRMESVDEL
ncbi:transient receptor potential ion channel subfamily C trp-1-like splice variant A [Dinothrombium tinctorium]|uniref:Transient receptor potential ion channel subfamily C trp-1-like splice variant A n=1 Tax=Dinothrombium tinctorium TaxID=1965070 RepID=A0A3S3R2L6_9ACAR|nr:transient receptor potential ion channel subfamily C trp-1-like splice variant A [Dinothrombium tinctorium]RWS17515.1 transient receptor potential ion channel subfamily C trp-1-like splice variant A [Dinothrombium tinctorium]RWS17524.1 transient receptor potential ion channel subfamily C trp-1-like splice variant A [Dinothrombium tinctorium]